MINVLSLFDGASCGMVALRELNAPIGRYFASEIHGPSIKISQNNWLEIEHIGDVNKVSVNKLPVIIDLLIGGSPCQGFSFAGKQLNFEDPRSELFFEFVRIWREVVAINPNAKFMLKNVKMKQEYQDVISEHLGVKPIEINSALVSAQNRKRLYWTNIEGVEQPKDLGIMLKDIVHENCYVDKDKSNAITATYQKKTVPDYFEKSYGQLVYCCPEGIYKDVEFIKKQAFAPSETDGVITLNPKKLDGPQTYQQDRIYADAGKMTTLSADLGRFLIFEPHLRVPENTKKGYCEVKVGDGVDLTFPSSKTRRGRLMDGKTNCLTDTTAKGFGILEKLSKCIVPFDETLKSIEKDVAAGKLGYFRQDSQANRVYYTNGKSITLCGDAGGGAAKMGQYLFGMVTRLDNGDGVLVEGYIRKLTPVECERLQTLPDNYTAGVSDAQRYKMLGNGWTCKVISHILKNYVDKYEK